MDFFGVRELYGQYESDSVKFSLGKQVFDWSVTDTVSPTDSLNPRDWTDIIEWERIGVPAASVTVGNDTYLQFVAAMFSVSRLPEESWTGDLPVEMDEEGRGAPQLALRSATLLDFGEDWCIRYV